MPNGIFEFPLCVSIQPRHNGTERLLYEPLRTVAASKKIHLAVPDLAVPGRVYRAITATLTANSRLTVVHREKSVKNGNAK